MVMLMVSHSHRLLGIISLEREGLNHIWDTVSPTGAPREKLYSWYSWFNFLSESSMYLCSKEFSIIDGVVHWNSTMLKDTLDSSHLCSCMNIYTGITQSRYNISYA